MNEPKHATFAVRRLPGNYRLEYSSHAGPKPGEWFGTFRVWRGDISVASGTLSTPCGGAGMAQTMAHNVGLGAVETDKRD